MVYTSMIYPYIGVLKKQNGTSSLITAPPQATTVSSSYSKKWHAFSSRYSSRYFSYINFSAFSCNKTIEPTSVNISIFSLAHHLCTVNRNAIVLLTLHQKYYGVKLLYAYRSYLAVFVLFISSLSACNMVSLAFIAPAFERGGVSPRG